MKRMIAGCALAAALLAFAAPASAQVANSSFEDPLVTSGPNGVGVWFAFNGGGGAIAQNSTAEPRTGAQHLALEIPGVNNNFAGVFQDIPGLSPGQMVTYSLWNKSAGAVLDVGPEVRIEWRNPGNTAEVTRTANLVPVLTSDYTQFTMNEVVPAGVGVARLVYAIQTFGPEPTNTGEVYVDDVSFTIVPEPSTATLLALGGLGLLRRRVK